MAEHPVTILWSTTSLHWPFPFGVAYAFSLLERFNWPLFLFLNQHGTFSPATGCFTVSCSMSLRRFPETGLLTSLLLPLGTHATLPPNRPRPPKSEILLSRGWYPTAVCGRAVCAKTTNSHPCKMYICFYVTFPPLLRLWTSCYLPFPRLGVSFCQPTLVFSREA